MIIHPLNTDSFDGSLGLVQNGEADIFLRPTTLLIDSDNKFDFSLPLISEEFHPFQAIENNVNHLETQNQTLIEFVDSIIPSRTFFAFHLASLLVYSLGMFALYSIYSKSLKLSNVAKLLSFHSERASFKQLVLAYSISVFLVQQLISNNVNTNRVLVPTDYLIDTKEKALAIDRETCFFEDSYEMIFYRTGK